VSVFTFAIIQPMPQIHYGFSAPIKPFQPTVCDSSGYFCGISLPNVNFIGELGVVFDNCGFRRHGVIFERHYKSHWIERTHPSTK
jgi:hypothetical protein